MYPHTSHSFLNYLCVQGLYERSWGNENRRFCVFLASGAGAGALASLLTNPLDIVKLRLQVQRGSTSTQARQRNNVVGYGGNFGYRNMVDGLCKLVRHEGAHGLLRGAGARMAFHAPMSAFGIALFEEFRIAFT